MRPHDFEQRLPVALEFLLSHPGHTGNGWVEFSYRSFEGVARSVVPVDDLQPPHPAELAQVARHQGCIA